MLPIFAGFRHLLVIHLCVRTQVNAVRALAQILRRYTSLNHLAQAARAVLQNSNQITQMLADINKVDFTSVQVSMSVFPSLGFSLKVKVWTGARILRYFETHLCLFLSVVGQVQHRPRRQSTWVLTDYDGKDLWKRRVLSLE